MTKTRMFILLLIAVAFWQRDTIAALLGYRDADEAFDKAKDAVPF